MRIATQNESTIQCESKKNKTPYTLLMSIQSTYGNLELKYLASLLTLTLTVTSAELLSPSWRAMHWRMVHGSKEINNSAIWNKNKQENNYKK